MSGRFPSAVPVLPFLLFLLLLLLGGPNLCWAERPGVTCTDRTHEILWKEHTYNWKEEATLQIQGENQLEAGIVLKHTAGQTAALGLGTAS
jgi:hypothetical protein